MLKVRTGLKSRSMADLEAGMLNESIVASGIYVSSYYLFMARCSLVQYYDEANITESQLAFRVAVSQPPYHEQHDGLCMRILYDITAYAYLLGSRQSTHLRTSDEPCVQAIGSMVRLLSELGLHIIQLENRIPRRAVF
jgi:hypothetical protein